MENHENLYREGTFGSVKGFENLELIRGAFQTESTVSETWGGMKSKSEILQFQLN